jgi:hypothetical protein
MSQNTVIRTSGAQWLKLEPAMEPELADLDHIKLKVAGAGATVAYPAGQIVAQKDDGTNEFAKIGTAGYAGPKRIINYPIVINELGQYQYGGTWVPPSDLATPELFEGSIAAYFQGFFKTQDLTGLADDATMATVGRLVRGTRAAGIIQLGAAPVAA